jgi:hypothetical protein
MVQTGDDATIIQAVEMIDSDAVVLGSIPVTGKGTYRISFKPTGSSVQLWVLGAYDILLKPTCYTYPVTTQETYLAQGNNNSVYTSWTTDPEIAKIFAMGKDGKYPGVILVKKIKIGEAVPNTSLSAKKQNEKEWLVRGIVIGATVKKMRR